MAMDEKGLGHRLQAARLRAGLTQQMLCERADLSYSTLTKIERGAIKSPSIFTIQNIAVALGVSLEELLGVAMPSGSPKKVKQRSRSGIAFVYFDINDCLVRFTHKAFIRLATESGASPDVVETLFWHYNDQVCRGDISLADFDAILSKELKITDVHWLDYYLDTVEPMPDMAKLVKWTAEHYSIGLLSNIMPGCIDALKRHHLLPDVQYDVILDSVTAGAIKPEARIFELATQKAACPASDILFIDDSRTNLMAAEKSGWHVLWFDGYQPQESVERIRETLAF